MDNQDIKEIEFQLETARRLLDWAKKDGSIYKVERFQETIDYLEKKLEGLKDER